MSFEAKQRWALFLSGFSGLFAQIFSKLKLLGLRLQPLHPHLQHHCFS